MSLLYPFANCSEKIIIVYRSKEIPLSSSKQLHDLHI